MTDKVNGNIREAMKAFDIWFCDFEPSRRSVRNWAAYSCAPSEILKGVSKMTIRSQQVMTAVKPHYKAIILEICGTKSKVITK